MYPLKGLSNLPLKTTSILLALSFLLHGMSLLAWPRNTRVDGSSGLMTGLCTMTYASKVCGNLGADREIFTRDERFPRSPPNCLSVSTHIFQYIDR